MATTRTVPTVDSNGVLYENQLPSRLSQTQLASTINDTIVSMLANGTNTGISFTYNPALNALSATVTAAVGGGSPTATPTDVPSAPRNLSVVSGSVTTTAVLSWTTPLSDGGSEITGYVYGRDGVDASGYGIYTSPLQPAATRQATFNNLVPGSTYQLSVRARNSNGDSIVATSTYAVPAAATGNTGGTGGSTNTGSNASGIALPTGSVSTSVGTFNMVYSTDFDTAAAVGTFPANSSYSSRFDSYAGYNDTSGNGTYDPSRTTFVQDSKLQVRMFTQNGTPYVSAPIVRATAGQSYSGQTYGRYSLCMRAVREVGSDDSYKIAFMLWPVDDQWPAHGEYDFPETDLATGSYPAAYHHYASSSGGQDAFAASASKSIFDWHTYTTEWSPGRITYYVDGASIGSSTTGVYNGPMRWTLQCETNLNGRKPTASTVTRVEVDWLAMWSRA